MHDKKVFVKDMTKREYFAAMAMAGDLASYGDGIVPPDAAAQMAETWVNCADALLRELSKTTEERMNELEMKHLAYERMKAAAMKKPHDPICLNGLTQEEMG